MNTNFNLDILLWYYWRRCSGARWPSYHRHH